MRKGNIFFKGVAVASFLLTAAVCPGNAQDTAKKVLRPLIAINDLTGRGITQQEATTLSDVLRNKLSQTKKFRVMERSEMDNILQEQGFQSSGACNDQSCIMEMGQLLGAQQLVAGSVGKVGHAYSINVRIVSIQTSEILNSVTHNYTGPVEGLLLYEMTKVAKKLAFGDDAVDEKSQAGKNKSFQEGADKTSRDGQENIEESDKKRGVIIGVASGVVIAGGITAVVLLSKGDEEDGSDDDPNDDGYGEINISW